jgi:predicted PurR-regulated permease PerM
MLAQTMWDEANGRREPAATPGTLAAPGWLREAGVSAWLGVGVALLTLAAVVLLLLTRTIVMPLIAATVIAAVASPLVRWLARKGLPRGAAAALLLVALIVAAGLVVALVVGGITSQLDAVRDLLRDARATLVDGAADAGLDRSAAEQADADTASAVSGAAGALLDGVVAGLAGLSSLVVFLSLTALSLFFLLKDGPDIRRWAEGHMGLPRPIAASITQHVLGALRGYFLGVTLVAAFNAVLVGTGAWILGVPLVGTIAAVTFVGAYIPYLGAWGAGAFSVLLALGGAGTEAALGMTVIQLLANGILQQMIQPIAYGTALGIHPLAVLVVTIAGGALFGTAGLILAAPLTAAATHVAADLRSARETAPPPRETPGAVPAT